METSPLRSNYFFDTTVLVAYFRREDKYTHDVMMQVLGGHATASISAVSVAEVFAASDMELPELRDRRIAVLGELQIVTVDRPIAERGDELRRMHNLELPDALIAACAEHVGGEFLSKDPHFERLLGANVLSGQVYVLDQLNAQSPIIDAAVLSRGGTIMCVTRCADNETESIFSTPLLCPERARNCCSVYM